MRGRGPGLHSAQGCVKDAVWTWVTERLVGKAVGWRLEEQDLQSSVDHLTKVTKSVVNSKADITKKNHGSKFGYKHACLYG